MKLIATLATLAALVGQTEAATSAITTQAVVLGNKCQDKLTIDLTVTEMAAADTLEIQLDGITTEKTALADVTTMADWDGASDQTTDESGAVTADPEITKDGTKTTWKFTLADAIAADPLRLSLINLCTPNIHDFDGAEIGLKTKMTVAASDGAASDSDFVAATASTLAGPIKLADFKVIKMPIAKGTEGEFEATFTGVSLSSKKVTLNLPAGYTVPAGSVCKIGPDAGTLVDVTASGGLGDAGTTNSETFTEDATITGVKTKFTCTKVKSGTTWEYDATKNVAIKIGSATVPTHAGYATMLTPGPTKAPTAADDSPASVATASGVVVGALGVAALFLA